jgi:hypothetical protein
MFAIYDALKFDMYFSEVHRYEALNWGFIGVCSDPNLDIINQVEWGRRYKDSSAPKYTLYYAYSV